MDYLYSIDGENFVKIKKQRKKLCSWPVIWLIQMISMLAVSVVIALSYYLSSALHGVLFWGGLSIAGFVSAYLATVKGLLNYAAWIMPPVMGFIGHYLIWDYMPNAGAILLCAFVSLVGAATGEVIKRQDKH
jgi:hypothetical protein